MKHAVKHRAGALRVLGLSQSPRTHPDRVGVAVGTWGGGGHGRQIERALWGLRHILVSVVKPQRSQ